MQMFRRLFRSRKTGLHARLFSAAPQASPAPSPSPSRFAKLKTCWRAWNFERAWNALTPDLKLKVFGGGLTVGGLLIGWCQWKQDNIRTYELAEADQRFKLVDSLQKEFSSEEFAKYQATLGVAMEEFMKDDSDLKLLKTAATKLRANPKDEKARHEWQNLIEKRVRLHAKKNFKVCDCYHEKRDEVRQKHDRVCPNPDCRKTMGPVRIEVARRQVTQYWERVRYTLYAGLTQNKKKGLLERVLQYAGLTKKEGIEHFQPDERTFQALSGMNCDRLHLFFLVCHPLNLRQNYTKMPDRTDLADTEDGKIRERVTKLTQFYVKHCGGKGKEDCVFSQRALERFPTDWSPASTGVDDAPTPTTPLSPAPAAVPAGNPAAADAKESKSGAAATAASK